MLIKIKCPHLPRLTITAINILTGVPIFLFYSYLTGEPLTFSQSTHPSVLLSVGYMAMLGTILGFTLLYYGYKHIEASEATLFSYLQPLVYIPLATLWLKEPLYPIQIFGLVMILIGVIIAQHRPHPSTLKSG
jgi:drug/metabolite transporter (DMT)-like permease